MSRYDLPAAFEYISNLTNQTLIDYIGHSQGSMIMFIALAENNPIILAHLKHTIFLGPVIYANHQTSNIFKFLDHSLTY
jgi:hypothetical protein